MSAYLENWIDNIKRVRNITVNLRPTNSFYNENRIRDFMFKRKKIES